MGILLIPLLIGFCVQLAALSIDRVTGKLLPIIVEGVIFAGLAVPVLTIPQADISSDTRFVLLLCALMAFFVLAGAGIAWLVYGAVHFIDRRSRKSVS